MAGLKGKVVLITGASSGIGQGCAVEFAHHGARLGLTGRNAERLQETVEACCKAGLAKDKILSVTGDVTKEADVNRIVDTVASKFGAIDVLVNNAGASTPKNFAQSTVADMDFVFGINVRSVFMVTKRAIPHIEKVKGNIINISSIVGLRPIAEYMVYSMSKATITQFTRTLALEEAPKGVRVNEVNPGSIMTDIYARMGLPVDSAEGKAQFEKAIGEMHPLGRAGTIPEVAKTIVFLASDDASFITAASLPVDGGLQATTAKPPAELTK